MRIAKLVEMPSRQSNAKGRINAKKKKNRNIFINKSGIDYFIFDVVVVVIVVIVVVVADLKYKYLPMLYFDVVVVVDDVVHINIRSKYLPILYCSSC